MTFNRARHIRPLRPSLSANAVIELERKSGAALYRADVDSTIRGVRARDGRARMLAGAVIDSFPPAAYSWLPRLAQAIPASVSFSRASIALVRTRQTAAANLVYEQVPSELIRFQGLRLINHSDGFDYGFGALGYEWTNLGTDSSVLTGGFALREPGTTNQIPTNDLTDAAWNRSNVDLPTDNGVNSIGLQEYSVGAGTATGAHRLRAVPAATAAGSAFVTAKAGTGRYVTLQRGTVTSRYACFDLVAGTVTEEGTITNSFMFPRGDGYYKCGVEDTNAGARLDIHFSDTGTPGTAAPSFTAADETILFCHEQYEDNDFPTSPVVTAGAAAARDVEVLDLTDWIAAAPYSVYLDYYSPEYLDANNRIARLGSTGTNFLKSNASGTVDIAASTGLAITLAGTVTADARNKFALRYAANDAALARDGVATGTDSSVTVDASAEGDLQFAGTFNIQRIAEVASYDLGLTDAQLESKVGN